MKKGIFSLLIGFIYIICSISSLAMNTGFVTEKIGEEDIPDIYERLNVQSIIEPDISIGFSCFDVNEMGNYALGFNSDKDEILVFDSQGNFLYGFSFEGTGTFGLEWDGESIILYRVRSDLAISIDKEGNCKEIKKIKDCPENTHYWNHEIYATKRTINGSVFTAENHLGILNTITAQTYSVLTKTLPNGDEVILFDITTQRKTALTTIIIIVGIFLSICIIGLILLLRRNIKRKMYNT